MTTFAAAYLMVWLAMTAYCGRMVAQQRRMLRQSDREDSKPCG